MFEKLITDLINDLIASEHTEGVLVFFVGSVITLLVQLSNEAEYKVGLKGTNKLFEAPEIALHLFFWYSPYIIMYGVFMQVEISLSVWYFMAANLAFALLGRIGLERIISMKIGGSSSTVEKKETVITKEVNNENS
jgi:hypothetical protein